MALTLSAQALESGQGKGLSETLKAVADRRLRLIAKRWTGNRVKAYGWGIMLGLISQSAAASTFISVGLPRSGLVSTVPALALLMGSYAGLTILVVVVTLDVEVFSLYASGLASIAIIGSRNRSVRTFATAIFGGALMILGLVLLKEAAAPLAQQPWFDGAIAWAHDSLWLVFLVSAALTFVVQSTAVVCVLGVTLASVGVLGVNETLMLVYGIRQFIRDVGGDGGKESRGAGGVVELAVEIGERVVATGRRCS